MSRRGIFRRLWSTRGASLAFILLGAILVARFAVRVQPVTEGVDYYSNVLYARDLANGASGVSLDRYAYLPGLYTFWRLALWLTGGSLDGVRWVYLGLLGINAALVGLILVRVTRGHVVAGVVGAFWYILVCSIYEGFQGLTEPIATAPLLAGLLVWAGRPLRGRDGWGRTLALGSGFGLALYGKQPGGLLALGAIALLVQNIKSAPPRPHEPQQLLALPVIAIAVFVGAVLLDGNGLEPIRIAYALIPRVWREQANSLVTNIALVANLNWLLWLGWLAAAVAWLVSIIRRRGAADEQVQMMGFCALATIASLEQFKIRPYGHYWLIGAPTAIIAAVLFGRAALGRLAAAWPESRWVAILSGSFAVLPLLAGYRGASSPFRFNSPLPQQLWRNDPQSAHDLGAVARLLQPDEDVLALPPRRNEIHVVARTRSVSFEHGYGWIPAPGIVRRAIANPGLHAVVVVKRLDPTDSLIWRRLDCGAAVERLTQDGFHLLLDLPTMSLWRRGQVPSQ